MATLSPNNPFEFVETALKYSTEFSYKGIELRATSITDNHGHSNVVHEHIDVPGGYVEITGRKAYIVEAEVVFAGANWEEKYANAIWLHDTQADQEGELIIPKGNSILLFDAKWTDAVSTWSSPKYGQIVRCTFKEHSYAEAHEIVESPSASSLRSQVPEEDSEVMMPLVDDYIDAIDNKTEDEVLLALSILSAQAIALAQIAKELDTPDSFDRYLALKGLISTGIRIFPNQDNTLLSQMIWQ
jgi:hypothetical protein